jgi:transcriptional regulator with XRE-family HTH domain
LRIRQGGAYLVLVAERSRQQGRDEGAQQTALIMAAVKRLRDAKGWSAQRLADEMSKVGVPWNADIVVNLEHGRRKSLRVHELLALAFVLDAETPQELIVPRPGPGGAFPVTPNLQLSDDAVRGWFLGQTGPLRQMVDPSQENPYVAQMRDVLRAQVESGAVSQEQVDSILSLTISYAHGKALEALAAAEAADSDGTTAADAGEEPS